MLHAAKLAARVAAIAYTFPDRLSDSRFSWLPYPHRDYSGWPVLLMAMLMEPSLAAAALEVLDRHPEDPNKEWHRLWLKRYVAQLRERFPDGVPPNPKRTAPVGLDEFLDRQTGKWR